MGNAFITNKQINKAPEGNNKDKTTKPMVIKDLHTEEIDEDDDDYYKH